MKIYHWVGLIFFSCSGVGNASQSLALPLPEPSRPAIEENRPLSNAEKLVMAQKFAPIAYLHPKEKYFPASVEPVARASVVKARTKQGTITLTKPGDIKSADDLRKFSSFQQDLYLDFNGDRTLYKGNIPVNNIVKAPLYFNIVEKSPGHYLIQYMFFYTHNGALFVDIYGRGIGYHEGDWEHLDVHVVKKDNQYILDRIHYARHGTDRGEIMPPNQIEFVEGHPVVYIAKYGHGAYPKNVKFISKDADLTGKGAVWRTWENLVSTGTPEDPTPGNGWIAFSGRWGTTDNKLNSSPRVPSAQDWWRSPGERITPIAQVEIKNLTKGVQASDYFQVLIRSRYQSVCFQLQYADGSPVESHIPINYRIMERKRLLKDQIFINTLGASQTCLRVGKDIKPSEVKGLYVQLQNTVPPGQLKQKLKLVVNTEEK